MSDKCPFCGNKENPSSSKSEDSCHWVGEYGEKFKGLRSLPCYERQIAQCQKRLAVAEELFKKIELESRYFPISPITVMGWNIEIREWRNHAPSEYVAVRRDHLATALKRWNDLELDLAIRYGGVEPVPELVEAKNLITTALEGK